MTIPGSLQAIPSNVDDRESTAAVQLKSISPAVVAIFIAIYATIALPSVLQGTVPTAILVLMSVVGAALICLSAIDMATERLPDVLTFTLCAIGLLIASLDGLEALGWAALAGITGYAVFAGLAACFKKVRGYAGLGLGDAKLLAAGGTLVGFEGLASVVLIGSVTALLFASATLPRSRQQAWTERIPFGPFLAIGIWSVWLHGPLTSV